MTASSPTLTNSKKDENSYSVQGRVYALGGRHEAYPIHAHQACPYQDVCGTRQGDQAAMAFLIIFGELLLLMMGRRPRGNITISRRAVNLMLLFR